MRSDSLWGLQKAPPCGACRKLPLLPWPSLWWTHPGKNQTCFDFRFSFFCKQPWSLKMAPEKLSFVLFEMTAVVFCWCCFTLCLQEKYVASSEVIHPTLLWTHLSLSSESRELLLERGCPLSSAETEEMSKCSLDWSLYSSHPFWSRRWTLIDYWPFSFWACPRESLLSPLQVC